MNTIARSDAERMERETLDVAPLHASRLPLLISIGVALCLAVIVGGLIYAAATGTLFGRWTFWAAIGAAIIAVFGLLSLLALRNETNARQTLTEPTYLEAFRFGPDPTLITRAGIPVLANDAYTTLAERVGVMGESGTPPTLDRLFAGASSHDTSASLYRLLQHGVGRERLHVLDEEGRLRFYEVDATRLSDRTDGATLWKVRDLTGPEPVATYLAEAPVGLATIDSEGRVIATNPTLTRWLGLSPEDTPAYLRDFLVDADSVIGTPREVGRTHRFDTQLATARGITTPTVAVVSWSQLQDGSPIGSLALYGHSNIVTKAAPIAPAFDPEEGRVAGETFHAAPFAIVQLDDPDLSKARIHRSNPAFDVLTGRAGAGMAFADIFADSAASVLSSGTSDFAEGPQDAMIMTANGKTLAANIYVVCSPHDEASCWAYIVDVSQRASLQKQLVQSQKMQAIGQLAAGVAHDFNNLLSSMRLNTDHLLERHPVGDPSYLELQGINSNVMRAASLVKKLLAFSREQTLEPEVLSVSEILSDLSVTLRQTLSERVKLDMSHGRDIPLISMDKSQLETVLINLCVNARDAMVESPANGGSLTIRSTRVDADDLPLKDAHDNDAVLIEVIDTGTGMSAETMEKIFEPFFTTKPQGKGTGLGLATVYGIVQQSGGHMEVTSTIGEGTTFRLYMPAADPTAIPTELPAAKGPRAPSNLSGQGTILFVEDEESVRTIAAKTLRKRGYKVIEAGDGEEAYEWLEGGDTVDLMISDVVMPGMDGPTLLKKGRALLGDARIVFISGYAKEEFSDLLKEEPDVTFLPKPFSLAQLAEKVKSEIGDGKAA